MPLKEAICNSFILTRPLWSVGQLLFWHVFPSGACTLPCSAVASPAAPSNLQPSFCQPDFSVSKNDKVITACVFK